LPQRIAKTKKLCRLREMMRSIPLVSPVISNIRHAKNPLQYWALRDEQARNSFKKPVARYAAYAVGEPALQTWYQVI